jgi:hypothetical protein
MLHIFTVCGVHLSLLWTARCFPGRGLFYSSGLVPTGRYFYGGFFLLLTGYGFIFSVPHFFPYKRPTLAFLSSLTYQVAEADCACDIERKKTKRGKEGAGTAEGGRNSRSQIRRQHKNREYLPNYSISPFCFISAPPSLVPCFPSSHKINDNKQKQMIPLNI